MQKKEDSILSKQNSVSEKEIRAAHENIFRSAPTLLIVSLCLVVMLAVYITKPETTFSDMENRYLTGMPSIKWSALSDGSFMNEFETYTEEQIPLRKQLIKLKAISEKLLLKTENDSIVVGKEGHLFEKLPDYSPQLKKNQQSVTMFAMNTDREINIAIVPNSFEILKDYMPIGIPNVSEKTAIDDFYDAIGKLENVNTIDVYQALKSESGSNLYYKTDHHWTTDGAYIGYKQICEEINTANAPLIPVELNYLQKKQIPDFYGTYYAKYKGTGITADTIDYYDIPIVSMKLPKQTVDSLYDLGKTETYDKYAMFMYGNEGLTTVEADNSEGLGRELILFKDSYSNCLIPFLTYNYDKIYVVDLRYFGGKVGELLDEHEEADILMIYNFLHFNDDNHFFKLL